MCLCTHRTRDANEVQQSRLTPTCLHFRLTVALYHSQCTSLALMLYRLAEPILVSGDTGNLAKGWGQLSCEAASGAGSSSRYSSTAGTCCCHCWLVVTCPVWCLASALQIMQWYHSYNYADDGKERKCRSNDCNDHDSGGAAGMLKVANLNYISKKLGSLEYW